MFRLLLIVLLLLTPAMHLRAQEEGVKKISKKENDLLRWSAGIALGITPLPDNQLSLLPGVEFFINDKFSVYHEIAVHVNKNQHADSGVLNKKYFRYKAELRYYFSASSLWSHPYFGIQFTTATRKFDIAKGGNYFERKENDSAWAFSSASVSSPFSTASVQVGLVKNLAEELFLESSLGYGFKIINTEYSSVSNLRKENYRGLFAIKPAAAYRYPGRTIQSQFTFFMRLSYHF
jgi:hypothetical protein